MCRGKFFFLKIFIYHGSMNSQALVKYDEVPAKFRKLDGSEKIQGGYLGQDMQWRGQKCSGTEGPE